MIKKRFTMKRESKHYNRGKETIVMKLDSEDTVYLLEEDEDCALVAGEVANRLYEYEELGYTPEKLRHIIKMYYVYKLQSYSTYGSLGSAYRDIHDIIDVAMKKRDRSVSLFFGSQGISVDVIPYPPIEEVEEENRDD